ncbi:MAG: transcription antitermination factor NusB [Candidatus Bipolaricaulia bacterium]
MQRSRARELVLFALYRAEFLPVDIEEAWEDEDPGDQRSYIESAYRGITDRRQEIDRLIGERTVGWRFDRLALLDRNILRIGVYELLYSSDVPPEVALDEAVELAKTYGTEQARGFINGILDRIWKERREREAT